MLEKASFAFPPVRQFQLDLIRDAAEQIDCDGVNLCFVRGPHYVAFEKPLLEAFAARYHEDARKVAPDDPRLGKVRAEFITPFVRCARNVLDQVGAKKGRKLTLSVWAWPTNENTWLGWTPQLEGLDVKGWINDRLINSVICQCGIDREIMELAKSRNGKFVYFSGYHGGQAMSPQNVTKAYRHGVKQFAFWDIDLSQIYPGVVGLDPAHRQPRRDGRLDGEAQRLSAAEDDQRRGRGKGHGRFDLLGRMNLRLGSRETLWRAGSTAPA